MGLRIRRDSLEARLSRLSYGIDKRSLFEENGCVAEQAKSNIQKPSEFLLLYRPTWKQLSITTIILATIVCLLRIQAIAGLGTKFIGGYERDAGLYIWLIRTLKI